MKTSVILIGMAGAGKSTIGAILAVKLGYKFIDLDEYIRNHEKSDLQEIIDKKGEDYLMEIEKRYMLEISLDHCIIAPGGSLILYPDLMDYLKERSTLVFLDTSFENICRRLVNASLRGIVGLKNKSLNQIYQERRPLYLKYAEISIDTTDKTPEEAAEEALEYYRRSK